MRFVFEDRKTAQAASWLLAQAGGTMNYMVLIKLMYLADRQMLIETGAPITGDRWVAMPHGPVLSQTYDDITTGKRETPTPWYEYITEPDRFDVSTTGRGDTGELSSYELGILESIYAKFGHMEKWTLVEYTHTLPEWTDPRGSSLPIEPDVILRGSGRADAEIRAITEAAEEVWFMKNLARIARVGSR